MKATLPCASIVLGCLLAAACGGGDSVGNSGVKADKPIADVTGEEGDLFCRYVEDVFSTFIEDLHRITCYYIGVEFAEDCEEFVPECLEEEVDEEIACDLSDLPPCAADVTVGEFEACLEESTGRLRDMAQSVSCTTDFEPFLEELETAGPACRLVEEKCPDLSDDGSSARAVPTTRWLAKLRAARLKAIE